MFGVVTVTPLQLMIARRVIDHLDVKRFYLININAHDSKVLRRKYHELAELAVEAQYLTLNGTGWDNYNKVSPVVTKWKAFGIDKLLFASIDNIFVQYIIGALDKAKIFTFDDGAVNIIPSGVYHQMPHLPLMQGLKYYILRGQRNQEWIRKATVCHYTIFDVPQNIVETTRLQRVTLFEHGFNQTPIPDAPIAKVFLGFSKADTYTKVVKQISPDYYLPHPMERRSDAFDNVVNSDELAEEFIGSLLLRYRRVAVYACGSTTLLNLSSERLDRYVVDLTEGESGWQTEFNQIAKRLGCTIISGRDVMNGDSGCQVSGNLGSKVQGALSGE